MIIPLWYIFENLERKQKPILPIQNSFKLYGELAISLQVKSLKIDKILFLISLQLIIYGLLHIQMDPKVKISLFITLILITMYLFFSRIQFVQNRKSIDTKLSRALKGNLQTRLFTSNDQSLHNIVFSINELIAELEKVRIKAKRSEESRNNFYLVSHTISEHHSPPLLDISML